MEMFEIDNYMGGIDDLSMGGIDKLYSGDFMSPEEYDNYTSRIGNLWSGDYGSADYYANELKNADPSSLLNILSGAKGLNLGNLLATGLGGLVGGLGAGSGAQRPTGYQGTIPRYQAVREQLPVAPTPEGEGAVGKRYFTDTQFVPKEGYAKGGLLDLAQGGATGYYLGGKTDGMADKIPATIASKQPAKLSHGEFVISADVVSALGSGNSEAGAKVLYNMMDRVRKHAHGTKKQIKPANLKKTLPA
jgi:hypothetical protein